MCRNLGLVMLALTLVGDSRGETTTIPSSKDVAVPLNATANIVGGCLTAGAYPSFATSANAIVSVVTPDNQNQLCGATLVAPDMLVSTARCLFAFTSSGNVYIGGTNRPGIGSDAPETRSISQFHVHPQWNVSTRLNDIMMIQLRERSQAPLTQWNTNSGVLVEGEALTVIGFGATTDGFGDSSPDLKQALVNVVTDQTCANTYKGVFPTNATATFCATKGNGAPCGDAGGPALNSKGIVGLSSSWWGNPCGSAPNAFTRVSTYSEWMQSTICKNSQFPPANCPARNGCGFFGTLFNFCK
jgi:secreted trypsin-like serine protease